MNLSHANCVKEGIPDIYERKLLTLSALGKEPADFIFSNCIVFNSFSCTWEKTSFAVKNGIILGPGDYHARKNVNLRGSRVIPGLIDSHVHIESSLLSPSEYARLVLKHGTTTVIADPHEIANVSGIKGIQFMLNEAKKSELDYFFLLPSCVPATPLDKGGATLNSADLSMLSKEPRVIGLAEMMNVPGVLNLDYEVWKKLFLFRLKDGHAPLTRGKDLNAYILAGPDSDHECTSYEEALEKLNKGMFIYLREGGTEKNLKSLISVVNPFTVPRCSFASDDRHIDSLINEGHIDDCIRKSVYYGLSLELAIRMATLSAAERFFLYDRGAIAPGRIADFCVLEESLEFRVRDTYKRGIKEEGTFSPLPDPIKSFFMTKPALNDLKLPVGRGIARVIGIIEDQILTRILNMNIESDHIPDTAADILKVVVCSRYEEEKVGIALVNGFGLKTGAIASSVAHDSHNVISVGVEDESILTAINAVIENEGGLSSVGKNKTQVLPLECAGLMSVKRYEEVSGELCALQEHTKLLTNLSNPFMYLSFLSLTVIPHIRVTERGLFSTEDWDFIPIFIR